MVLFCRGGGGRREAQLPNPTGGLLYLCVSIARDIAVL